MVLGHYSLILETNLSPDVDPYHTVVKIKMY